MINLIVAIARNNVIGKGNELPWHYKEDMEYFRRTTLNKTVIMGEATFQSILGYIGKPLPNRTSVIATLSGYQYPGVETTDDIISYLKNFPKDQDIFIIGGKVIYDITLDIADRLYITHIDKDYDGDVYFSEIDYSKYNLVQEQVRGELRFCVYERRAT
ncbi:dihydrofolate reductase [Candidatus Xianfuyuplasma coldseepsis]|uniref:Dihydrofolate reductase n=1 Tax=Candidatus Xianfuyuplasma coldseepsis TaxID=2782163 RepID=A0A7L7KSV3_9MOLU|nr:dihydrofolate reductase [Xianfuyuplasma coldseepsis]QMS85823.1 dihydrofolate reductase [Xianfuyuplasma coldseepsis]